MMLLMWYDGSNVNDDDGDDSENDEWQGLCENGINCLLLDRQLITVSFSFSVGNLQ